MSTIAIDKTGTVASDSQVTFGARKGTLTDPKIIQNLEGFTFGIVGDCIDVWQFSAWWMAGADPEDRPFDKDTKFTAIIVEPGTEATCLEMDESDRRTATRVNLPHAIGSGVDFALGALYMGATAQQAVEAASAYDVYTGGAITMLSRGKVEISCPTTTTILTKPKAPKKKSPSRSK